MAERRDLYDLYELAAQSPGRQARFLQAIAGEHARSLGEDFCGTGALSVAWVSLSAEHRAVAVDRDEGPLEVLLERLDGDECCDRVEALHSDVMDCDRAVDVIAALNFSIGYFHERADLLGYLRHARGRLAAGNGAFVCDLYGGADQFALGESELELSGGVRYTWEQRDANPLTARVVNAMHFDLADGTKLCDAFVYAWRLWSPAELRDALVEAGFGDVSFYDRLGDAELGDGSLIVRPAPGDELDENFVVYVAARA